MVGSSGPEDVRLDQGNAVLVIGRAPSQRSSAPSFLGTAALTLCQPNAVIATIVMAVPDRDFAPEDRAHILAMASSLRRAPVPEAPIAQCLENEEPDACASACDGGDADSCVKLGYLKHSGEEVARDEAGARALFERGCKAGSDKGCRALKILQRP